MDNSKTRGKDDLAYRLIKDKILQLELVPRQPLRELELSEMLNMSRTPVHAAIARLISDGFVEEIGPKQNIVTDITVAAFRDIYQMREVLENLCVSLATYAWKTPEDLRHAKELVQQQYEIAKPPRVDSRAFLLADRAFHSELATISGNQLLRQEMLRIYDLYWRYNFYSMHANRARQIVDEHREILESIALRDRHQARESMKEHLAATKDEILVGIAEGFDPARILPQVESGYVIEDHI